MWAQVNFHDPTSVLIELKRDSELEEETLVHDLIKLGMVYVKEEKNSLNINLEIIISLS
jgi:hypothetical protein